MTYGLLDNDVDLDRIWEFALLGVGENMDSFEAELVAGVCPPKATTHMTTAGIHSLSIDAWSLSFQNLRRL